jgi:hypothetical protein
MLLRRISQHVQNQNWFAVFLDFLIVVVGVFIGIQVANWNDKQAFYDKETELLIELKLEIEVANAYADYINSSYNQVSEAGRRSLKFMSEKKSCETDCWLKLVDLMHASQWQVARVSRQVYEEMRRIGLPRSRKITDSVDLFLADNESTALNFDDKPHYRDLIRQLMPIDVQDFYWENCYSYIDNKEIYELNCPKGVSDKVSLQLVNSITQHPDIQPHLTQWTSNTRFTRNDAANRNQKADEAIKAINDELERR